MPEEHAPVNKSDFRLLVGLIVLLVSVYVIGILGGFVLSSHLASIDQRFILAIPLLFAVVPALGIAIVIRSKLLKGPQGIRDTAYALLALYVLTWLAVLYVFIKNIFPGIL